MTDTTNTTDTTTTTTTTASATPAPVTWFELHSSDPARAREFYGAVFGVWCPPT
jgi:hypothetical protein